MELEIHLDLEEAGAADLPRIEQEFQAWCVATGVGSPKSLPSLHALRVDMGGRDCITALMDLHSRLYHYKAKIFIQFIHGPIG
ncbi:MAG: hypothetical protein COZ12_03800 [Deltaproteobacteria bacterium CG_4_10_14_3_um_filter_60_8]|nr:MAG: hypothetical protein AUK28_11450 [Desulfobacterales bacterium CG2_30_60_27]PIY21951.1 MAG: hypothetical protein COZ12_03800 [Deltaproteobacteria bacterium CG_4_10_14_3_um_filter_60_8]